MIFNVLTLFPEMFDSLSHSIIKRAQEGEKILINTLNIRDFSDNKHKKVDDYPYGGGQGMVMKIQPIEDALLSLKPQGPIIYLTPKGKVFNQQMANEFANFDEVTFICGHYEGVDQRVIDSLVTHEISIGDYVLTGGELPAMIMIDGIARLKKGVLSSQASFEDESHYNGLLEYPHYTRPSQHKGLQVPDVLLSGNHKHIELFRLEESLKLTYERRPDMFKSFIERSDLSKVERKIIRKILDNQIEK